FRQNGDVWLVDSNGLWVSRDRGKNWSFLRTLPGPINQLIEGQDGVYFAGQNGLLVVDDKGKAKNSPMLAEPGISQEHLRRLMWDADGRLWVGTFHQGLYVWDTKKGFWSHYAPNGRRGELGQGQILSLEQSHDGTIWIGTGLAGLFSYHVDRERFKHIFAASEHPGSYTNNFVRALCPVENGLWLGTDGAGICWFPSTTALGLKNVRQYNLSGARIWSFLRVGPDLYAGSDGGLLRFNPTEDEWQLVESTRAIAVRTLRYWHGHIWMGTFGDGLYKLSPDLAKPDRLKPEQAWDPRILALSADETHLFLGTLDGVWRMSADRWQFEMVPGAEGLPTRSLCLDSQGILWVGSSRGLFGLDVTGKRPDRHFGEEEGLPNNTVYAILEQSPGTLWLSTNNGIARIKPETGEVWSFGMEDGLQSREFNGGAAARDANGWMYFGGINGFNEFDPRSIQPNSFSPKPLVTVVETIAGKTLVDPGSATIQIVKANPYFRLGLAELDFAMPEKLRFRYRLLGDSDEWIDAGARNEITYTNLAPGHYQLELMAANHDGVWTERPASFKVLVPYPYYRSPLAMALYAMVLFIIIFVLFRMASSMRASHRALKESEDRLQWALWGSGDGLWDWDMVSGLVFRTRFKEWLGYEHEEIREPVTIRSQLIHPDDQARVTANLDEHLNGNTPHYEAIYRLRSRSGEWKWVLDRGRVVQRDALGKPLRMAGTHKDIGAEIEVQEQLRLASRAIESTEEGVILFDHDMNIISVNPAFEGLTGFEQNAVKHQPFDAYLAKSEMPGSWFVEFQADLENRGSWKGELWLCHADQPPFLAWANVNAVQDPLKINHYVMVFSDITQRKRDEEELRYLANYDTLTQLPNRTFFAERLERAILRAERNKKHIALLFIDLDRFKQINDSLGHNTGDALLCSVAERLTHCVRKEDTVARLGGDEFTVVLERLDRAQDSAHVAEKILEQLTQPFQLGPYELVVTPSIGISFYPQDGADPQSLLRNADTAMYSAKNKGRNNFQFYSQEMNASSLTRLEREAALRHALARNELEIHYQPQIALETGRFTGVEALIRWRSHQWGLISPADFIPIAEETGLIVNIGEWVLSQAIRDYRQWEEKGIAPPRLAINLSPRQVFSNEFLDRTKQILDEQHFDPNTLEFELTESLLLDVSKQNIQTMVQLTRLGIRLALDDFGTGYSSLSYLKRFPIGVLKVDRSFVNDVAEHEEARSLVGSMIAMARRLGLTVVAEGIENPSQLDILKREGCDVGQGYLYSKPLPSSELMLWIQSYAATVES
ncbi:MAG: EAL domain-containing protein, partial [Acidobacteria bacterium]|nr:EAL domain-containing protein [Acidobacteriota bacterium]